MSDHTKLVAVGDISLGDFPLTIGFGIRSNLESKRCCLFNKEVKKIFKNADLCFGNLETVISDVNYDPTCLVSAQMRGNPNNIVELLADSGLNLLSVANNHTMQHGSDAFKETVSLLHSLNISTVGLADSTGRSIPYMHEKNGETFCFLGYSLRPEKYNKPALYSKGTKEIILADIEQYKNNCDYLVLSLHWGDEFVDFPSPDQVLIAHEFINAGARIIIGHHPHIVQGVERYNGGVIAYSLGNFVFEFWQKRLKESMILAVTFSGGNIEDLEIIPAHINKYYEPVLLKGKEAVILAKRYQKLSRHPVLMSDSEMKGCYGVYRKKYDQQVRFRLIENKIQSRLFFLRHLHKYPEGIAWQSLTKFVSDRLVKKKWK